MGSQLVLFSPAVEDADERLKRAVGEMRLQQAARDATKPPFRPEHRQKRVATCPSCGGRVILEG